jgi:acetyl esterase/lipase
MAYPRVAAVPTASGGRFYSGVCYAELTGFRPLLLDLHVPPATGDSLPPLVIYIHGGGFLSGDRRYLPDTMAQGSVFEELNAAGLACATIDYRLTGEAKFPAALDDTIAAIDFLVANGSEYGVDASRLGTWGESAGAVLAVIAGLDDRRVSAVVGWYTPTDMRPTDPAFEGDDFTDGLFGAPMTQVPDLVAKASAVTHVTPEAPPMLLVHGDADELVPVGDSLLLHELLIATGTKSVYRPVPGADHCFLGYDDIPGLVDESVRFLAAEL